MIKIKKYVTCDNCGWETEIDQSTIQCQAINDVHYIEYGQFHFCCTDCKNEFLRKYASERDGK